MGLATVFRPTAGSGWTLVEARVLPAPSSSETFTLTLTTTPKIWRITVAGAEANVGSGFIVAKPNNLTTNQTGVYTLDTAAVAPATPTAYSNAMYIGEALQNGLVFGVFEMHECGGALGRSFKSISTDVNSGGSLYRFMNWGRWNAATAVTSWVVATTAGQLATGTTIVIEAFIS